MLKKLILTVAAVLLFASSAEAQRTQPDRIDVIIAAIPDSLAIKFVLYDAEYRVIELRRRGKTPLLVPVLIDCSVVVVPDSVVIIDTLNPFNRTPQGREQCQNKLEEAMKRLNPDPEPRAPETPRAGRKEAGN